MSNERLAQVWFASRPDEWDALSDYTREHSLYHCGWLIRYKRGEVTWVK